MDITGCELSFGSLATEDVGFLANDGQREVRAGQREPAWDINMFEA